MFSSLLIPRIKYNCFFVYCPIKLISNLIDHISRFFVGSLEFSIYTVMSSMKSCIYVPFWCLCFIFSPPISPHSLGPLGQCWTEMVRVKSLSLGTKWPVFHHYIWLSFVCCLWNRLILLPFLIAKSFYRNYIVDNVKCFLYIS